MSLNSWLQQVLTNTFHTEHLLAFLQTRPDDKLEDGSNVGCAILKHQSLQKGFSLPAHQDSEELIGTRLCDRRSREIQLNLGRLVQKALELHPERTTLEACAQKGPADLSQLKVIPHNRHNVEPAGRLEAIQRLTSSL